MNLNICVCTGRTQRMTHNKRREFITHKATHINMHIVMHLPTTFGKTFDRLEHGKAQNCTLRKLP